MPNGWYDDADADNLPDTYINYNYEPSKVICAPNTNENVSSDKGTCSNCGFNIYSNGGNGSGNGWGLRITWNPYGSSWSRVSNWGTLEIGDYARVKYTIYSKRTTGMIKYWSSFRIERKDNEDYNCSVTNWV